MQITPNVAAFLATVRRSEGTARASDPFRCCYGYKHTIADLSRHPAEVRPDGTVEWKGEPLDHLGAAYVGKHSDAAGAYQIILPTWRTVKRILRLPDFTAPSQNEAAVELIREAGALELVNAGQIADAIEKCHGIWASLPGSTSGQPQQTMADLIRTYGNSGGAFA